MSPALPTDLVLLSGAHGSPEQGMCVMEAVAYVAGEPHSDHPECACPVISTFLRTWNDDLRDNDTRTKLLAPLIPKIVGTRSTPEVELARVMLIVDWTIREFTPKWLDRVDALKPDAAALRAAKPIQSWEDLDAVLDLLRGARGRADAAWESARGAAWDAAWEAAWGAARDAAWDAARDAARGAAWVAARGAAWEAARDAAWGAARAAARAALKPTTEALQQSAVRLVERMCAVK